MRDLLSESLGLSPKDAGEIFSFAIPLPPWAWAGVVVACGAVAAWSYWHLEGRRPPRMFLAMVRALVLILLAVLICGPQYVRQNERIERDWVAVLVDRSASMQTPDAAPPGQPRQTRAQEVERALRDASQTFSELSTRSNLLWLGFDTSAYDLPAAGGIPAIDPAEAVGVSTNLSAALEQTLRRVAARPVSGIVLISDGRTPAPPGRALMKRLQAEQVPVIAVPVGREVSPPDVAVARVDAPRSVFVDDIVPINVELSLSSPGSTESREVSVELLDAQGNVVDRQRARIVPELDGRGTSNVTLTSTPTDAGVRSWSVRVSSDAEDIAPENNAAPVRFEAVDRQIRVLYLDGYPRWEYRYLRNLLIREKSIRASATLLAADRRFIQEGTEPITSIPVSPEDWARYDVVIIGDVRSELFSPEQLANLREHIAGRGAGLLWIAGPGATPGTWGVTPLGDLLPLEQGSEAAVTPFASPVTVDRAPAAERLGLLRLGEKADQGWPSTLSDPGLGWTKLWWAQNISPKALKPTAETLAYALPESEPDPDSPIGDAGGASPLVVTMRFGAGRVVYVGTDETWRWRYARGEPLPERFWLPIVRLLARESLSRADAPAILEVAPVRAATGRPVRVAVRVLDQRVLENQPSSISAGVTRVDVREPVPVRLSLAPESGQPGVFSTTWVPDAPGSYRVEASDASLGGTTLSGVVEVFTPDDERRTPQTDFQTLQTLAQETGGRVLPLERLEELPELLPNRQLRISDAPEIRTLWDTPLALGALLTLLVIEWVGRRLIRLI